MTRLEAVEGQPAEVGRRAIRRPPRPRRRSRSDAAPSAADDQASTPDRHVRNSGQGNDSHTFNPRWPPHARFHGVVALAMTSTLAGLNLWSLWSPSNDRRTSRRFAAAVPAAYRTPFLVAPLIPGTGVDDPPHPNPPGRGRALNANLTPTVTGP